MKKYIIAASLITTGFFTSAQTVEQKSLYKSATGFEIQASIRNATDTTIYFYFGFQNEKYEYITDIGSIFYVQKKDVEDFANALNTLSDKTEKANIEIMVGDNSVSLYDFADSIFIEDKKGKYKTVTKKFAKKMALDILAHTYLFKK